MRMPEKYLSIKGFFTSTRHTGKMKQGSTSSLIAPAKSYWISQWAAAARAHGWRERSVRASSDGFTLLELSVVLVIIGLIVGGIKVGADMIRGSELKSVITDVDRYKTSLNTFRLKYNAVPGDMKNASAYWLDATSCPNSAAPAGCNGNGNGLIDIGTERFRAWQHLSLAEIIAGNFNGIQGSGAEFDVNMPASSIAGAGYDIMYQDYDYYQKKNSSFIQFGGALGDYANGPGISPDDAHYIDRKADDGLADSGDIFGFNGSGTLPSNCVTGSHSAAASSYILPSSDISCRVYFWLK